MVLPMARSSASAAFPYSIENRSFPSSPGSATDLSPSGYSEAKGYFDFIPIGSGHYDRSAPISPGSLSVPGSDNELGPHESTTPTSRQSPSLVRNQRDSKARCLKKLDNAMEKLIGILPSEMQLSCKRGRANGLKLVEEYIMRIIAENNQVRSENKKKDIELDRSVSDNRQLHAELKQLRDELTRLKMQNQYR